MHLSRESGDLEKEHASVSIVELVLVAIGKVVRVSFLQVCQYERFIVET